MVGEPPESGWNSVKQINFLGSWKETQARQTSKFVFWGVTVTAWCRTRGGGRGRAERRRGGKEKKKSLFLFPDAAWAEQPVLIAAYRWFCMFGLSRADKWPALAAADSLLFSKWRSWWGHVMTPQRSLLQWIVPYNNTLKWWPSTAEEVNHSLGQKYRRKKKTTKKHHVAGMLWAGWLTLWRSQTPSNRKHVTEKERTGDAGYGIYFMNKAQKCHSVVFKMHFFTFICNLDFMFCVDMKCSKDKIIR